MFQPDVIHHSTEMIIYILKYTEIFMFLLFCVDKWNIRSYTSFNQLSIISDFTWEVFINPQDWH